MRRVLVNTVLGPAYVYPGIGVSRQRQRLARQGQVVRVYVDRAFRQDVGHEQTLRTAAATSAPPRRPIGCRGEAPPLILAYASIYSFPFQHCEDWYVVQPGAFDAALRVGINCFALMNHDVACVVAERDCGTLHFVPDDHGLLAAVQPADDARGWLLVEDIRAGRVTGMSLSWPRIRCVEDHHSKLGRVVQRVERVVLLDEISFLTDSRGANPIGCCGLVSDLARIGPARFRESLTEFSCFNPSVEEMRAGAMASLAETAQTIMRYGLPTFLERRRAMR